MGRWHVDGRGLGNGEDEGTGGWEGDGVGRGGGKVMGR